MLHLEIITPEETVFAGDVTSVTLPTADGEITVLERHIPLITALTPGTAIVRYDGREDVFAVSRGVVEVDGKSARVLADIADRAEKLEEAAVEAAKSKAEQLRSERRTDAEGFADATALLERELARLRTVRRHKARGGRRAA